MTVLRGRLAGRGFPAGGKAAEMIDAQQVKLGQGESDALDPPAKAVGSHPGPIVKRVAPELAGLAEVIRRHAGDDCRISAIVKSKKFALSPDVSRIMRHKNRQVADHAHATQAS